MTFGVPTGPRPGTEATAGENGIPGGTPPDGAPPGGPPGPPGTVGGIPGGAPIIPPGGPVIAESSIFTISSRFGRPSIILMRPFSNAPYAGRNHGSPFI